MTQQVFKAIGRRYTKASYATLCKGWHRPMSKRFIKNLLTPCREQPRPTRIVYGIKRDSKPPKTPSCRPRMCPGTVCVITIAEGADRARCTFVEFPRTALCIRARVQMKIRTHLDLLSIPQSGEKMSKRLGGVMGCKDKTSSWHLIGFPRTRAYYACWGVCVQLVARP